jgi:UTP--glucose-1-phosphate uridylyltransferase
MTKRPTKAIIAAAGLGTRFLPQTKAMPKEMLPIIDKPVIQLIVEEAVSAGVTEVIIVTGSTKRAIEDHFDRSVELEDELRQKGKNAAADEIERIANLANFVYVRQKGLPKGNARPVLNAAHLIGDEPFFVLFADDLFQASIPRAAQLIEAYEQTGTSVVSLIKIDKKDADKYGVPKIGVRVSDKVVKIDELVEKPGPKNAPSSYGAVGGYLLTPEILPEIAKQKVGHGGELVLADSINALALQGKVHGRIIDGQYHDTGNKELYLKAVIDTALRDATLGPKVRAYLAKRLKRG